MKLVLQLQTTTKSLDLLLDPAAAEVTTGMVGDPVSSAAGRLTPAEASTAPADVDWIGAGLCNERK